MTGCAWNPGPARPGLTGDEIHVWAVELTRPPEPLAVLLSADEQARAARFKFDADRRRFTVSRGTLRQLLARYLPLEPARIQFDVGPQGKPAPAGQPEFHFNLAHSGELALIAVTKNQPVGVDVEQLRPMPDREMIARRFFSKAEFAALQTVPAAEQNRAFFNAWTRKEAFIKALGKGLSHPLDAFDVSLAPGQPVRLLRIAGNPKAAAGWTLAHLEPAPGYIGALAVEYPRPAVRCWAFPSAV